MFRRVLLVAVIATALAALGQGQGTPVGSTPPAPAGTTQVYQTPVYVPAPSPIVGGYYTGYYGGVYGLTTPSATFTSPQPTAGISLADRAGISSNTPLATGVQSTLGPSTLVYTNVQPVAPAAPEITAIPVAPAPAAVTPDMGLSYFADAGGIGPGPAPRAVVSLGEVAAQYKSRTLQNVRTYTNADVEQANARMNLGGINVNARLGATPAAPPTEIARAEKPPRPVKPSAAAAQPTTPQVSKPQPGEQAPVKELPATATLLPLLGILGLAGGGIGLIFRRYRK
jgi:hypothetical protein